MRRFVAPLVEAFGLHVSTRTLRRLARALGYAWKRCRPSLKARRDPDAFAAMRTHLRGLHAAEARGELAVVYVDECRFSRQAPVPYAWQRRGAPAVPLPAEREAGGQSVLGFWQPGACGQPLSAYALAGAWNAEAFVAAVDECSAHGRDGPAVLVLDNASIHRARLVQERRAHWACHGLSLCYLPAYSPELNKIELLWHRCKHYWLAPADYACDHTLQQRVAHILARVGREYTITFG